MRRFVMFAGIAALTIGSYAAAQDNYQDSYQPGSNRSARSQDRQDNEPNRNRVARQSRRQQEAESLGGDMSSAKQMIDQYDNNGDGVLERSELPRRLQSQFSQLDRNGNDELSRNELQQHSSRMQQKAAPAEILYVWVTGADQGRVSLNDLQEAYDTLMDIDENEDGQLTREELRNRRQELASKWAKKVIQRLDENDNDRISRKEAQDSFLGGRFSKVDQNSDDQVTREELQQCVLGNERSARHSSR